MKLLAHSAQPKKGLPEQSYIDHIHGVVKRVEQNISNMMHYSTIPDNDKINIIVLLSGLWHDLGKLDEENQAVLRGDKKMRHLLINHVDAGVAYLLSIKQMESAFLVLSHHKGLQSLYKELNREKKYIFRDADICDKTNEKLPVYKNLHDIEVGYHINNHNSLNLKDGLTRRLAFSCLVDGDHGDSANYNKPIYETRWEERLKKLDEYVQKQFKTFGETERNILRNEIYYSCRDSIIDSSIYSCDSPVGTGKTTAVMAHLLQAAIKKNLRHIIVVLPYTNIIKQSVEVYREAVVLDGENPEYIVAEHDHQADFSTPECCGVATLWNAPIIVTTAVQFFETIGSNHPSRLRKMHELPGSAIFIDETHAAIPVWLWPQSWVWLKQLRNEWNVHLVLASGTLPRFWNLEDFIQSGETVVELVSDEVRNKAVIFEKNRVLIRNIQPAFSVDEFIDFVLSKIGPRLIIMNTVYSAAFIAKMLLEKGKDVLHLSTALTPKDRAKIIDEVGRRLDNKNNYHDDWLLVGTSCIEAGVDFSFRTAFRENCSFASLIQTGGRINRHGLYDQSELYNFQIINEYVKQHPAFKTSQRVLKELFKEDLFSQMNTTELMTEAMRRELKLDYDDKVEQIQKLENTNQYPEVAKLCKIINTDSRLVVIDEFIVKRLEGGERVSSQELIKNSVQIWISKIGNMGLANIDGYPELYKWYEDGYDSDFLGYMKAIFDLDLFKKEGYAII